MGYTFRNWGEYYRSIGKILQVWGIIQGTTFFLVALIYLVRSIFISNLNSFVLKIVFVERVLILLFILNIVSTIIGLMSGWPLGGIAGDFYKGLFFPLIYFFMKKSIRTTEQILIFTRLIIWCETIVLIILVSTDLIPLSFAGRTFLTTIFFTLLFEEQSPLRKLLYIFLVLFGIYVLLTTAAQRGITIIFVIVVILNYVFQLRRVKLASVIILFVIPPVLLIGINAYFDLKLEENFKKASTRFEESLTGKRKYFGLDESLFQRVGETIDIASMYQQAPAYKLLIGFGNGAMLENKLQTPSEHWVYKTRVKHNIYITPVSVFFRQGIIGLILWNGIFVYLLYCFRFLYKARKFLRPKKEAVYFKVLLFYQTSVFILGLIVYWYIGNIIIAFTLPLLEILRQNLSKEYHSVTTGNKPMLGPQ